MAESKHYRKTDRKSDDEERIEEARERRIAGAMGLKDSVGYYGSRQSDDPSRRIAEQHFRFPYGHYNPQRRYLRGDSPGWPVSGGDFTGRGPKGYRRHDGRIEDDIVQRLTWHDQIDATNIIVRVKNGEVILEGTVDSRRTKRQAQDVALSVSGVFDVHNRLRISP